MAYDMLLPEMHGSIMGFDGCGCTTDVDNMSACGKGAERSVSAIRYFAEYLWQVTLSCQKALHRCFLAFNSWWWMQQIYDHNMSQICFFHPFNCTDN